MRRVPFRPSASCRVPLGRLRCGAELRRRKCRSSSWLKRPLPVQRRPPSAVSRSCGEGLALPFFESLPKEPRPGGRLAPGVAGAVGAVSPSHPQCLRRPLPFKAPRHFCGEAWRSLGLGPAGRFQCSDTPHSPSSTSCTVATRSDEVTAAGPRRGPQKFKGAERRRSR